VGPGGAGDARLPRDGRAVSGPRVGLNALFLDPGVSGGSETYLRGLVPALVAAQPGVRFEVATTRRGARSLAAQALDESVEVLELPCDDDEPVRRTVVEQVLLPRVARRRRWDLVHSLANRGPRWSPAASVVTVLDVIFFHQRTMSAVSTHGMRIAVRAAVSGADVVIAISEAAADDIAGTLEIDRSRIAAIPLGPGKEPGSPEPERDVRRRYGLESARVVLCVAAKRPHKNQCLLVEALRQLPPDVHLVLVGHDEGYGTEIARRAAEAGVLERTRLLDYVPDGELESLWAMAWCAAFPTLAEGFGLPVLEAMRRGVPVACSDLAVLREVGSDVPHYFDPREPSSAATAITSAARNADAAAAGRRRATQFSWEETARRHWNIYERVLEERPARRAPVG
jgi:glycosyltransferase involved in cell wall biosynthesis